jgi:hypothetical protein
VKLYKAGTNGRIKLEGVVRDGMHYTVEQPDDGTIVLTPVEVVTTGTRTVSGLPDDE